MEETPSEEYWPCWKVSGFAARRNGARTNYACHVRFWERDQALLEKYIKAAAFIEKQNPLWRNDRTFAIAVVWDHFQKMARYSNLESGFKLEDSDVVSSIQAPSGEPTATSEKGWRLWVHEVSTTPPPQGVSDKKFNRRSGNIQGI